MIDIDTRPVKGHDPWVYARKLFVRLLLVGATAMIVIGWTEYRQGLSTPFDKVMLPILATVTLATAWIIARSRRLMMRALAVNAALLIFYYEGILFQGVQSSDPVNIYSLASIAQFLPGLYIALFVFLNRRAALVSWLIYGTVVAQFGYGLYLSDGSPNAALQRQVFGAILAAHPCCILVLSFMTHLRRMIEEARHESIAAKERFLAVVSHEVRSPLQTIVSSLELVEKAPPGPLMERAMRRIMGAATLLETQIRDLTAFTRLELTPELHVAEIDLRALALAIEQTLQLQARPQGVSLNFDLPDGPLTVQADGARLRQVIDNLVSNALKYTTAGSVTLGLRQEADGLVHWWIQDTGRGIAPDQVLRVFEPFVRIKAHPQERIEGSGLGLAVVRQLVGLMKGQIQVDSVLGQGTTMHLWLPLPPVASPQDGEHLARPACVLVVDDDADILQCITDLLRAWGVAEVIECPDGLSARQMLQARPVDVALIDLQLPGASGYEVARSARLSGANQNTPLIAMSAVTLDKGVQGASAFDDYLPKPVSRQALVQTIVKACRASQRTA